MRRIAIHHHMVTAVRFPIVLLIFLPPGDRAHGLSLTTYLAARGMGISQRPYLVNLTATVSRRA